MVYNAKIGRKKRVKKILVTKRFIENLIFSLIVFDFNSIQRFNFLAKKKRQKSCLLI